MTKTSLLIAAALCAASVTPAFAQESAPDVAQRTISYSDLDLSTAAGVAVLDARFTRAVKEVCGSADMRDLSGWKAMSDCRAETQARVTASRSTLLTAARTNKGARLTVLAAK